MSARPHPSGKDEVQEQQTGRDAAARPTVPAGDEVGEPITIANEFSEIRVRRVATRNGARLLVEAPRSGQWVTLCPLELEALTWQGPATFSAMIAHPFGPLVEEEP